MSYHRTSKYHNSNVLILPQNTIANGKKKTRFREIMCCSERHSVVLFCIDGLTRCFHGLVFLWPPFSAKAPIWEPLESLTFKCIVKSDSSVGEPLWRDKWCARLLLASVVY